MYLKKYKLYVVVKWMLSPDYELVFKLTDARLQFAYTYPIGNGANQSRVLLEFIC